MPVNPIVAGAAIQAGGSLLGGLMGRSKHDDQAFFENVAFQTADMNFQREMFDKNAALQREFAKSGIRWRVEDALQAGVHPLYALGSGVTPFSASVGSAPQSSSSRGGVRSGLGQGIADASQSIGRAVAAQMTEEQRMVNAATLDRMAAETELDYARATLAREEASRLRNPSAAPFPSLGDARGIVGGSSGGDDGSFVHQGVPEIPGGSSSALAPFYDRSRIRPSDVTAASSLDNARAAGRPGPMWKTYVYKDEDGRQMLIDLPAANDVGESLEPLSESKLLLTWTIMRNIRKYGQAWWVEFGKDFMEVFK